MAAWDTLRPGRPCPDAAAGLGHAPLLVRAAVAGPQVQLGALGRAERGIVEAGARGRVDQLAVDGDPLLVGAAVAGPFLDQRAVGVAAAGDVEALAVDADGPVALHRPLLRRPV